jgi:hypothetical protein
MRVHAVAGWAIVRCTLHAEGGDCNGNGQDDAIDLRSGTSLDCNLNGLPDECDARFRMVDWGASSTLMDAVGVFGLLAVDLNDDATSMS